MAALGTSVVVLNGRFVLHLSPIGDALAFGACLCWAFYSLLMIPASQRYSSMFITRKVFFYGLLTMIPYYAWNHRGAGFMEVWMPQTISALGNY
jgi:drug/metabolite transporter (DMT)-like permease